MRTIEESEFCKKIELTDGYETWKLKKLVTVAKSYVRLFLPRKANSKHILGRVK